MSTGAMATPSTDRRLVAPCPDFDMPTTSVGMAPGWGVRARKTTEAIRQAGPKTRRNGVADPGQLGKGLAREMTLPIVTEQAGHEHGRGLPGDHPPLAVPQEPAAGPQRDQIAQPRPERHRGHDIPGRGKRTTAGPRPTATATPTAASPGRPPRASTRSTRPPAKYAAIRTVFGRPTARSKPARPGAAVRPRWARP